ncbi:Secreted RxLR effector protein 27 [Phytophthora ramorum]|uniref:Secreted RxLR effector protein 27 n=1 Tax=Phytophthora ramorum TaxID=164328 RepID=UPI0030B55C27|nr:Secreted RxLR effector protein 27 [Phytophthora ramorum]
MTSRLLSRRSGRPLAALALLSGGAYAADEANAKVLSRSLRVFATGGQVAWDYRVNFKGVERDDADYRPKLQGLNQRIAQRLLHLCFQNGGIYTKLGQQLATFNHGLPKEYTETLAQLQDQAKPVSFDDVVQTIETEMGRPWQDIFNEFDHTPIASASLAQVHHAVDHRGRELAVKVQYPHLESQMKADIRVIKWAFQLTEYFFPDIQIQWIFPEFKRALLSELDFENEKSNSRRIAACLKHNSAIHVPIVYDDLSTKRMMSMEFIAAPKISQIDAINQLGLDPPAVARALCEVFSEMAFCLGFVHCDPHAGNIFVRRNPDPQAKRKEQLVLLDHGLYRELDGEFRKTYCDLWRAMLMRDSALLEDCGRRLNVGDLAKYLPLLFTYRTIDHKGRLDAAMSESERKKLSEDLKSMRVSNISDFLEQLPRDMLFVFRTNNMIRSLNKDLGGTTRERFSIMGNYAVSGHSAFYSSSAEGGRIGVWGSLGYWWEHLNLIIRLRIVDYLMAVIQYARGEPLAKIKRVG